MLEQLEDKHPMELLPYLPLLRGEIRPDLLLDLGYIPQHMEETRFQYSASECNHTADVFDSTTCEDICLECGIVKHHRSHQIGYSDMCNFSTTRKRLYKPLDHLIIILEEMQCKRMVIPDRMLEDIQEALCDKPIHFTSVRKVLRRLGYKQHYMMIPTILQNLNPTSFPPLQLSNQEILQIQKRFKMYLEAFYHLTAEDKQHRKNILNYHFVIRKIAQQLQLTKMFTYLQPLKGVKTITNHERIWRIICTHNGW